jgi:hypothetical protein
VLLCSIACKSISKPSQAAARKAVMYFHSNLPFPSRKNESLSCGLISAVCSRITHGTGLRPADFHWPHIGVRHA